MMKLAMKLCLLAMFATLLWATEQKDVERMRQEDLDKMTHMTTWALEEYGYIIDAEREKIVSEYIGRMPWDSMFDRDPSRHFGVCNDIYKKYGSLIVAEYGWKTRHRPAMRQHVSCAHVQEQAQQKTHEKTHEKTQEHTQKMDFDIILEACAEGRLPEIETGEARLIEEIDVALMQYAMLRRKKVHMKLGRPSLEEPPKDQQTPAERQQREQGREAARQRLLQVKLDKTKAGSNGKAAVFENTGAYRQDGSFDRQKMQTGFEIESLFDMTHGEQELRSILDRHVKKHKKLRMELEEHKEKQRKERHEEQQTRLRLLREVHQRQTEKDLQQLVEEQQRQQHTLKQKHLQRQNEEQKIQKELEERANFQRRREEQQKRQMALERKQKEKRQRAYTQRREILLQKQHEEQQRTKQIRRQQRQQRSEDEAPRQHAHNDESNLIVDLTHKRSLRTKVAKRTTMIHLKEHVDLSTFEDRIPKRKGTQQRPIVVDDESPTKKKSLSCHAGIRNSHKPKRSKLAPPPSEHAAPVAARRTTPERTEKRLWAEEHFNEPPEEILRPKRSRAAEQTSNNPKCPGDNQPQSESAVQKELDTAPVELVESPEKEIPEAERVEPQNNQNMLYPGFSNSDPCQQEQEGSEKILPAENVSQEVQVSQKENVSQEVQVSQKENVSQEVSQKENVSQEVQVSQKENVQAEETAAESNVEVEIAEPRMHAATCIEPPGEELSEEELSDQEVDVEVEMSPDWQVTPPEPHEEEPCEEANVVPPEMVPGKGIEPESADDDAFVKTDLLKQIRRLKRLGGWSGWKVANHYTMKLEKLSIPELHDFLNKLQKHLLSPDDPHTPNPFWPTDNSLSN